MNRELFKLTRADGTVLNFAHLTIYDLYGRPDDPQMNGLVISYLARLKRRMVDNCKLAGLDSAQILVELDNFDRHEPAGFDAFMKLINEPAGMGIQQVMEFSWKQANSDAAFPEMLVAEWERVRDGLLGPAGITFGRTDEPAGEQPEQPEDGPEGNEPAPPSPTGGEPSKTSTKPAA